MKGLRKLKSAIIPLLLLAVIGFATFDFADRSLQPVREETQRAQQQTEMLKKQTIQGRTALQDDARISSAYTKATAMLPDEAKLAEVISEIDTLARSNRLHWASGAPSPTPVTGDDVPAGLSAWTMSASFTGPLTGIYRFIDNIDEMTRLVSVQSFTMQQSGGEYTVSFVLRFYALGV